MGLRTAAFAALLSVACAGCATANRDYGLAPDVIKTELTELPGPTGVQSFALRPLETVEIKVLQDASLSGPYFIDERGIIDFPYVGEITAAGRSPNELAGLIRAGLNGGYLVDPDVNVRPGERIVPTVSLGGEVAQSGPIPLSSGTTLMRAINAAGGTSEYARKDEVLIIREFEGQRYLGLYNLAAIQRGNYRDPELAPNDIVMVGESAIARRFSTIFQYLPLLTTAVILLDQTGIIE